MMHSLEITLLGLGSQTPKLQVFEHTTSEGSHRDPPIRVAHNPSSKGYTNWKIRGHSELQKRGRERHVGGTCLHTTAQRFSSTLDYMDIRPDNLAERSTRGIEITPLARGFIRQCCRIIAQGRIISAIPHCPFRFCEYSAIQQLIGFPKKPEQRLVRLGEIHHEVVPLPRDEQHMNSDKVMEDPPCSGRLSGFAFLVRKRGPMVPKRGANARLQRRIYQQAHGHDH